MREQLPPTVVLLTPRGRGAVATLLVEGPGAVEAVAALVRTAGGRPWSGAPADRPVFGRFGPEPAEEVVVRRRADGPVELHCHGGVAAVEMVRRALVARGCRETDWRQWLRHGCKDLIAAEARIALADARTERAAAVLLDQFLGALRREITGIVQAVECADREAALTRLGDLLARAPVGCHLAEPWQVVLAGRPNVGKSSLVNALLGFSRAIVHHEPGTTRDVVTALTALDGWPVQLADTAGLREGRGPVEQAGVALAREQLAAADLAVLVFDLSRPWSEEDAALRASAPGALVVHNKCDLLPSRTGLPACLSPSFPLSPDHRPPGLSVSALTGEGVGELAGRIARRLVPAPPSPGTAVPFAPAHVEAIRSALAALERGDQDRVVAALRRIVGA